MEAIEVLNNNKYDILDDILEDINNNHIKMNDKEKKVLVNRFQRVVESFIWKMIEVDPVFSVIFNRIGYTGSYFEGLRVGEATEFDLNLILKPKLEINADKQGCPAGFISLVIKEKYENLPVDYRHLATVVGKRTLLDPNLVSNWLQGVVYRTLRVIKVEDLKDCQIYTICKSGPAWTLVVYSCEDPVTAIHIDLVPVLEFNSYQLPVRKLSGSVCGGTWFAVPKPPRGGYSIHWRLSFPLQEKAIIRDLRFFKYTLRLLKMVRDQFQFHAIASYYIKTLFLWELERQGSSFWTFHRRGRLFIYMLIRLKHALEKEKIPFFWDKDCNLIEHVPPSCLRNFHGRLRKFLDDIDYLIDRRHYEHLEIFIRNQLCSRIVIKEMAAEEQYSFTTQFILTVIVIFIIYLFSNSVDK